jgi:Tol biopolymer transport system component
VTLSPRTRLGPYEITAKLGEGGMGEVYRATDTRLKRDVAIKVLPAAFTEDKERLARFEREAQVLAQLHHPHIASIFGVEESAGVRALVMELVDGDDLTRHIARGPISPDEAIPIAVQIAEALEAAHGRGIVHRDLKPANVKVTQAGDVKVLDFGIAKAFGTEAGAAGETDPLLSPTLTHATEQGVILGTVAYMSPEQARGAPVDRRTDIWAFGVVLFEMLAGRRPFPGENRSEVLAAVVRAEVDWAALPTAMPAEVRRLLRRCLKRDPQHRLRDIGDARIALEEIVRGDGEPATAPVRLPPSAGRRPRAAALGWLAALLVTAATASVLTARLHHPNAPPRPPMRLALRLGPDEEMLPDRTGPLSFSPDGRTLWISAWTDGRQIILRRALDEPTARPVEGTDGGFWTAPSPDGRWLAFTTGSSIRKVAAEGGRPFDLAAARPGLGATWLPDGTLVFAPIYSDGLYRASAEGGAAERLTSPDHAAGELDHIWPDALPGGGKVVFTAMRTPVDTSRLGVLDLATRKVTWVVDAGYYGRYVPTGHLLFARGQRLFAAPFDAERAAVTGPAVAVVDDLCVSQTGGFGVFAVSAQGTLAYLAGEVGRPPTELLWVDRRGSTQPVTAERRHFRSVQLSPDGSAAAVSILDDSSDLWLYSFARGTLSRLTSAKSMEFDPAWSTDGRELFYVVDTTVFFDLRRMDVAAPDSGRPIWNDAAKLDHTHLAVAPDARWAAYVQSSETAGHDIYVRPLDGSQPARAFRATGADELSPCFSPDGRWIAYQSDETGRPEIYAEAFPGPGERFQISADGGAEPVWTRGSRELFFRHGDEVRVVATRLGASLTFDAPRSLFTLPFAPADPEGDRTYDVTADGSRLLVVHVPEASVPRQIEIVTDWASQLPRLVPATER